MKLKDVKVITAEEGASAIKCPECKSYNIVVTDRDGDSNEVWETCDCEDCGLSFRLVYRFKQVEIDIYEE